MSILKNIWIITIGWCIAITGLWIVAGVSVGWLNLLYEDWATEYLSIPVVIVWEDGIASASREEMHQVLEDDPWVVGINSIGVQDIAESLDDDEQTSEESETILKEILPPIWQVMVKFPVNKVLEVPIMESFSMLALKIGEWGSYSGINEIRWDPKTVKNLLFTFEKWSHASKNLFRTGMVGWILVIIGITLLWLIWPVNSVNNEELLSLFLISTLFVAGLVTFGTILMHEFLSISEVESFLAYSITSIVMYMIVFWVFKVWIIRKTCT